ncbi:MAG: NosD domain-containing protein, partial [Candidatus Thorarchaeota archaeon]
MRYIQQRLGCSVIGFLLLTGFFYHLNLGYFGDIYLDSIQPIEIFNNKTSGTYENITIDNLPGSWNNWTWAVTQPWCSGLGTLETPYLIEGHTLSIDENFDGIHISNSQGINFKIKDCIFIWDGVIPAGTGISLINTTNGVIFNNTIYDISVGIEINGCENLIIRNNTIYNTMEGLSLFQSHFNELSENIIHNNVYGIRLEGSNNNSIYLNFFLKNGIHSID